VSRTRSHLALALLTIGCLAFAAPRALAIPALQIWSPDATYYDTTTDTWIIPSDTFELWVIGDVGSKGVIDGVDLAASFYGTSGSITVTPISPATAVPDLNPDFNKPGYAGLLTHADFANADGHQYWSIGDFTSTSDNIIDYQPGQTGTSTGEIKKFMIHVSGYDSVHFDAFDHYYTEAGMSVQTHYVFAPFSHDATGGGGSGGSGGSGGGGGSVPVPGTLSLFGSGLIGLILHRRRRK
jgi:hypothetical protein